MAAGRGAPWLFIQLERIRTTAASMYDNHILQGHRPEEATGIIQPLRDQAARTIATGIEMDLPAVILAIEQYESQGKAHYQDAQFLLDKARDSRGHADSIRGALIKFMESKDVTEVQAGGFSATLVRGQLTIR
jgi:hypothetical protein